MIRLILDQPQGFFFPFYLQNKYTLAWRDRLQKILRLQYLLEKCKNAIIRALGGPTVKGLCVPIWATWLLVGADLSSVGSSFGCILE